MSKYVEDSGCTCDTPTGSESRRCSYCRSGGSTPQPKKRKKKKAPKVKIYYHEENDILCIVEGSKIWKYVGEFSPDLLKLAVLVTDGWYKAHFHPESKLNEGYVLIGEMK